MVLVTHVLIYRLIEDDTVPLTQASMHRCNMLSTIKYSNVSIFPTREQRVLLFVSGTGIRQVSFLLLFAGVSCFGSASNASFPSKFIIMSLSIGTAIPRDMYFNARFKRMTRKLWRQTKYSCVNFLYRRRCGMVVAVPPCSRKALKKELIRCMVIISLGRLIVCLQLRITSLRIDSFGGLR